MSADCLGSLLQYHYIDDTIDEQLAVSFLMTNQIDRALSGSHDALTSYYLVSRIAHQATHHHASRLFAIGCCCNYRDQSYRVEKPPPTYVRTPRLWRCFSSFFALSSSSVPNYSPERGLAAARMCQFRLDMYPLP